MRAIYNINMTLKNDSFFNYYEILVPTIRIKNHNNNKYLLLNSSYLHGLLQSFRKPIFFLIH